MQNKASTPVKRYSLIGWQRILWSLPLLCALLGLQQARADVDTVELALHESYPLQLHWDNVEGPPVWLSGSTPLYSDHHGLHVVQLAPGDQVSVRVPAGERLRVYSPEGQVKPEELQLALSNGSDLSVHSTMQIAADGQSLLMAPVYSGPMIATLQHPADAAGAIIVALFVSRTEPLADIEPYRTVVAPDADSVGMALGAFVAPQTYWFLPRNQSVRVPVAGAGRYAIETRYTYPPLGATLRQNYQLRVFTGEQQLGEWSLDTVPLSDMPAFINGSARMLGQSKINFFELQNDANDLQLRATADVYVRLLKQNKNYSLAANTPPAVKVLPPAAHTEAPLDDAEITAGFAPDADISQQQAAAQRLIHDARRESPLAGTALLLQEAPHHLAYPELQQDANALQSANTEWRNLLPRTGNSTYVHYLVRPLASVEDRERGVTLGESQLEAWLGAIPSAYLSELKPQESLQYTLPARPVPTFLRLIANAKDLHAGQYVELSIDDGPPTEIEVQPVLIDDIEYQIDPVTAAVTVETAQSDGLFGPTLDGRFAALNRPAPLIRAALAELPLPPTARTIRLRTANGVPLRIALQYRAAQSYRWTEAQYLHLMHAPNARAVFEKVLAGIPPQDAEESSLQAYWVPLWRELSALQRAFNANVTEQKDAQALPPEQLEKLRQQARSAEAAGDWETALEAWSQQARSDWTAAEPALGTARALSELGEDYLAEQQLRGLLRYGRDPAARAAALPQLIRYYAELRDNESMQGAYAAAMRDLENLRGLVPVMLDAGEDENVLALALLFPDDQTAQDTALSAAYRLGWWEALAQLLEARPPAERDFWRALRLQRQGAYDKAMQILSGLKSEDAQRYAAALREAMALRQQLHSASAAERVDAAAHWMQWIAPGPQHYEPAPELVAEPTTVVQLYAVELDRIATMHLATAERPLKLRVVGPARLRIEARPLYATQAAEPLDGWIRVSDGPIQREIPIWHNYPAQGLQMLDGRAGFPGLKVSGEFDVSAGVHDLEIKTAPLAALIDVAQMRPVLPLSVLPPLTPQSLSAALTGPLPSPATRACTSLTCITLISPEGDISRFEPAQGVPTGAEILATSWPHALVRPSSQAALETYPSPQEDPRSELTELAYHVEQDPSKRATALVHAGALDAPNRKLAGMQALVDRIEQDTVWTPISSVDSSAGIRALPVVDWQPEVPSLRVRRALLRPTQPQEYVIDGYSQWVYSAKLLHPATLELELELAELPFVPAAPLNVHYQIDAQAPQSLQLNAAKPVQHVALHLSPGDRSVRVSIEGVVADQFLRMRMHESVPATVPLPVVERNYHVATAREPVRLRIVGPAWLRIDDAENGSLRSSYREIAPGAQAIVLSPEPQHSERLMRLWVRNVTPDTPEVPPRVLTHEVIPVPDTPVKLAAEPLPSTLHLYDNLKLGGQEDGTWSLGQSLVQETPAEDSTAAGQAVRFLETNAVYRYFDEPRQLWFETAGQLRIREDGGQVFGVGEHIEHRPAWTPFTMVLDLQLHAQPDTADQSVAWSSYSNAQLIWDRELGPQSAHHPYAQIFHRYLSVDNPDGAALHKLDFDVYTPYKADHRYGLGLGDTFGYRPWLDTLVRAGLEVVSNEDFNVVKPDHVALNAGWKQHIGSGDIGASYQMVHYLSDADRNTAITRNALGFDASWNKWRNDGNRFEYGFSLRRETNPTDVAGNVYAIWHFSNGRGDRDFPPSEVDFGDLRQRQLPEKYNNRIMP